MPAALSSMDPVDVFLLLKILVFLISCAVQYTAWRVFRASVLRTSRPFTRRIAATVFLIFNLPGVYIAVFSRFPVPLVSHYGFASAYVIWQCSGLILLTLAAVRRAAARSARRNPVRKGNPGQGLHSSQAGNRIDEGRRKFLVAGSAGLTIFTTAGAVGGVNDSEDFEITRTDIRMPDLPDALIGFTIAMIADLHAGPFMDFETLVRYVPVIQSAKPDMILLPGDFVMNRNEEVDPVCEVVRRLTAPFGVYGCLGNHDFFADPDFIARELSNAGVRMLRDEHFIIDPHGEKLALIGIDDVRRYHPFDKLFAQAVKGLDPSVPNILLCHKPYYLENAASWGVDFMVSGHTHGGQIVLARIFDVVITPAALISGYIDGLYTHDATRMYVTRGIGTVGIPLRINCPPEVSLFRLVRDTERPAIK